MNALYVLAAIWLVGGGVLIAYGIGRLHGVADRQERETA